MTAVDRKSVGAGVVVMSVHNLAEVVVMAVHNLAEVVVDSMVVYNLVEIAAVAAGPL